MDFLVGASIKPQTKGKEAFLKACTIIKNAGAIVNKEYPTQAISSRVIGSAKEENGAEHHALSSKRGETREGR